ncbi:BatD family protein [Sediminitomix flava]|uniref:Oxygen tolerance protein BatD n=1 Tax=Sediminitomix flava TaxID=379075 RepID=A0A315Z0F5_SEDFL|nr:BatD family protein [Sediminitomix flava]PWJ36147.1 oxygen tolerance protein BatD [Sediminitomix flava]
MKRILNSMGVMLGILLFSHLNVQAQKISIEYGKTEIGENENFQITLKITNDRLKEYSGFPDIEGFRKGRPSSSSETRVINGKVSTSQSIIQYYSPSKQGTFKVPSFSIKVNGKDISTSGTTIKVGPPVERQVQDPFAAFWGGNSGYRQNRQPQEFIEVKDDAFFAINTDKRKVFKGEGFTMDVSFYVATSNRADLEFYQLPEQLNKILKDIKPANCWEENHTIETINAEYVKIGDKHYRQFKIYESTFYPFNDQDIDIPKAGLKMVKFKEAKQKSFFGMNKKEDFKMYYSSPKKIEVLDLPENPTFVDVNVGNYRLEENYTGGTTNLETGKGFTYRFTIKGEGNINAISEPRVKETEAFLFYPPAVVQNVNRANGKVYGSKVYEYYVEPLEPGEYKLKDFISWQFFNTRTKQYETLTSDFEFKVTGESLKNQEISNRDFGDFYDRIDDENNSLSATVDSPWIRIIINGSILLLFGGTIFLVFKQVRVDKFKK